MATISPYDVLMSLRRNRAAVLRQVDRALAAAVAAGTDARIVAARVRRFFSPFAAPRRAPTGRVLRGERSPGDWPLRPGRASAHARLLMETETTAAHARAILRTAKGRGMGVRWVLAPAHPRGDRCDQHARRDDGWGAGVYRPEDAPILPEHPRCRCLFVTIPLKEAA